jgi:hypothetical protein
MDLKTHTKKRISDTDSVLTEASKRVAIFVSAAKDQSRMRVRV